MTSESQYPDQAQKEIVWEEISAEVEVMTDRLGMRVDEGIKKAVIALRANGFPTYGSCEGHLEREAVLSPYVLVSTQEFEGWEDDENVADRMRSENLGNQRRILMLLNEFYEDRKSPYDAHLTLETFGPTDGFALCSIGADVMKILDVRERREKLTLYRQEMDDFADFLRNQFFSNELVQFKRVNPL